MRMRLLASLLVIGLFLAGSATPQAAADDIKSRLPTDLDIVPRDAAAFVHLRAADLWRSDWAKDVRYLVDRAGPEAWKTFQKKCPVDPSTLDRITLILLTPQTFSVPFPTVDPEALSALVVVTTTKPYDRLPIIQGLGAREKVYRQNLYYFNEEFWSGLVLIDERTFLIGSEEALVRYFEMSRHKNDSGPLQAALAEAPGKHQATIGFNPTLLGKEPGVSRAPEPVRNLFQAYCGTLTLHLDKGIQVDARLDFLKESEAKDGEALRDTLNLGRQGLAEPIAFLEKTLRDPNKASAANLPEDFAALVGLGFLRELDSLLKEAPITRQGLVVKGNVTHRKMESATMVAVFSGLGLINMLGIRANATFNTVANQLGKDAKDPLEEHLRAVAKAMEAFHAKHGTYPPPAIYDKEGRPVLSWRVALLPYLGEEALYKEFKLDEPWDSLHNKRLLKRLPNGLRSPNDYGYGSGRWKTTTQVFAGENTAFEGKQGIRKTDLARQSTLLAHLTQDNAVYWTKPADVAYASDKPLPNLFGKYQARFEVLLADGTYRVIERGIDEKALRALIERTADKPRPQRKPDGPSSKAAELEAAWKEFSQNDEAGTRKAWQDIGAMIQAPGQVVPFLKDRVQPVARPDAKRIARWLTDLDSGSFKAREKAMAELEALGELAAPAIDKNLTDSTLSLEARRRLEKLMQKPKTVLSSTELRTVRAIEVLRGIGTPEARAVLADLAGGGEGAVVTEEAQRALAPLVRRSREK